MKLSIIIPVYNIESYLERCVESILAQSYKDFEILLINDGSTDRSGEICEIYINKDPRVKYYQQTNKGVSAARNLGIENARGEWISFVDGDDWIEEGALEKIMEKSTDSDIDMIIAKSFTHDGERTGAERYSFNKSLLLKCYSGIELIIDNSYFRGSVCGVLIKRELINRHDIYFPLNLKNGEDTIYTSLIMIYARKIVFVDVHLYNVYEREGSASRNWNFDRVYHMINNISYLNNYIQNNPGLSDEAIHVLNFNKYVAVSNMYNAFAAIFSFKKYFQISKELKNNWTGKINTGRITINKEKIRLLNLSLSVFSFFVITNRKIANYKKN